ncbi:hypothetical protein QBC47DRAFT_409182 [Echria macrotheca]|uniref:Uncharacterized protein n=1 Tax=Echria macrotheca TaxID=438768 RepID=A0AAJ0BMR1_9PEZI|nr:hypothetical protein QBC47DRAFT_409182 [Echria macrotheca]
MNKGAHHHSSNSRGKRKGKGKEKDEPRQSPEVSRRHYPPGEAYGYSQDQPDPGHYLTGEHGEGYTGQSQVYHDEANGQFTASHEQDFGDDGTTPYSETDGSHYILSSPQPQFGPASGSIDQPYDFGQDHGEPSSFQDEWANDDRDQTAGYGQPQLQGDPDRPGGDTGLQGVQESMFELNLQDGIPDGQLGDQSSSHIRGGGGYLAEPLEVVPLSTSTWEPTDEVEDGTSNHEDYGANQDHGYNAASDWPDSQEDGSSYPSSSQHSAYPDYQDSERYAKPKIKCITLHVRRKNTKKPWLTLRAMLDSANSLGPMICQEALDKLGFGEKDITTGPRTFATVNQEFATTFGGLKLNYRHDGGEKDRKNIFDVVNTIPGKFDMILPSESYAPGPFYAPVDDDADVVAATIASSSPMTEEERQLQKDRLREQEEEAKELERERLAKQEQKKKNKKKR